MRIRNALDRIFSRLAGGRRRCQSAPEVRPLEERRLLTAPTATMTQAATFPNLESLPNVATQALLYFSSTMGTLTEVDVVTSGSFSTQFSAENLASSSSKITGTTSGNLSINVPTGAIPVTIPAVTESYNASAYDGADNDGGTSGKTFTPETSSSAVQTAVLTSPADLAAFTGSFRIPITVSGHATGTATATSGDISDTFKTQTSATITVIYHYIPNLPSLNPPATGQNTGSGTGSAASSAQSGSTSQVAAIQTTSTHTTQSKAHAKKKAPKVVVPAHKVAKHPKVVAHSSKVKKSK